MRTRSLKIHISDSIGEISAEVIEPENMKAMMVLAHGAGAGMSHPFLRTLSDELSSFGIGTLRYNFPYMEKGKKRPDVPAVAIKTVEQVVAKASTLFPDNALILAGKSFGGRMSSHLLARHTPEVLKAIVFYGFPLHAVGKPGVERATHLITIKVPMLFLQGTKDDLAQVELIKSVCDGLPSATLEFLEGADHSFKIGKKDSIVDLSKKTNDWLVARNII